MVQCGGWSLVRCGGCADWCGVVGVGVLVSSVGTAACVNPCRALPAPTRACAAHDMMAPDTARGNSISTDAGTNEGKARAPRRRRGYEARRGGLTETRRGGEEEERNEGGGRRRGMKEVRRGSTHVGLKVTSASSNSLKALRHWRSYLPAPRHTHTQHAYRGSEEGTWRHGQRRGSKRTVAIRAETTSQTNSNQTRA